MATRACRTFEARGSFEDRRRQRLAAFQPCVRPRIARLIAAGPQFEDLADSFPALLFALATDHGQGARRDLALLLVREGAPLRDIAAALRLPNWLRRVPPQALERRLPDFPLDDAFAIAATSRLSAGLDDPGAWLDRLAAAQALLGRAFALWALKEARFWQPQFLDEDLAWMLAWAWASQTPGFHGHRYLRTPWHPAIGWKRASEETALWRKRVELIGALANGPRAPWFENGEIIGLTIEHLQTPADFVTESVVMDNCLDQYATHLSYGRVQIYSVRRKGKPVADVELTLRSDEVTMPAIAQIRGPRNRRASPLIWQAVHAWLGAQQFRKLSAQPTPPRLARAALADFWSPLVGELEALGYPDKAPWPVRSNRQPAKRARASRRIPARPLLDAETGPA
ncbi:MAG: hypothetical protein R3D68_05215 [Hyphomicrobiaceae bacterium]